MKRFILIISLSLIFLVIQKSSGHKITITDRTISWKSVQQTELKSSSELTGKFTIVTRQLQTIDLIQDDTKQFRIIGINGSWNNLSEDGRLEYLVDYQNVAGRVTISRLNAVTSITIDFSDTFPAGINSKFLIKSLEF